MDIELDFPHPWWGLSNQGLEINIWLKNSSVPYTEPTYLLCCGWGLQVILSRTKKYFQLKVVVQCHCVLPYFCITKMQHTCLFSCKMPVNLFASATILKKEYIKSSIRCACTTWLATELQHFLALKLLSLEGYWEGKETKFLACSRH